jgi:predicted nucleotide-binding protein
MGGDFIILTKTKMALKSNQPQTKVAVLTISNEEFRQKLTDRINGGEELFSRPIQNNDDLKKLETDIKLWSEYNSEMLKQVFNYPDNDYMKSYNYAGFNLFGGIQFGKVENDPIATNKNHVNYKVESLKSLLNKIDLFKSEKINTTLTVTKTLSKNEIFIVHGHDDLAKTQVARFIEKLKLKPIILHEQVNSGKTIIEKIEKFSNVGFGIVLYTPCDKGCENGKETNLSNRARQNVVFEHGYLIGKVGRQHVCALVKGDIETPNDISGVIYIAMNDNNSWQFEIAKEMKNSGYNIDLNNLL